MLSIINSNIVFMICFCSLQWNHQHYHHHHYHHHSNQMPHWFSQTAILCQTCVRVPVLSEKMYSICPSSSLRVVVRALAGVSVFSWYIWLSRLIHQLLPNLISSTLMCNERLLREHHIGNVSWDYQLNIHMFIMQSWKVKMWQFFKKII